SPVHFRKVSMLLILLQYNNSLQFLSEEFLCFRLSCSIATPSSSFQKSIHSPDSAPIQLNNSLQFTPEKSPPVSFSLSPLQKSSYASDSAPVEQQLLTLTEELPCFRFSSISSSLQKNLHAPGFAPVEQQLPTHDRRTSMLQIQLQYSKTTASDSFYNSLQFAPEESLPVSFSLSPLQKSSYASDSAPVDRQLPTLTKEHPCFKLNCSIATSLSSLQRNFNASDSVPVEQQPPKQQ
uniref:Uncharacterized protein n=1 Tax=Strongyloides stercoralis TaxID=6248 RepID=A0AAF5D0H1_STRER